MGFLIISSRSLHYAGHIRPSQPNDTCGYGTGWLCLSTLVCKRLSSTRPRRGQEDDGVRSPSPSKHGAGGILNAIDKSAPFLRVLHGNGCYSNGGLPIYSGVPFTITRIRLLCLRGGAEGGGRRAEGGGARRAVAGMGSIPLPYWQHTHTNITM